MAKMATCSCGWTVISPLGAEDVKKHTRIHLKDNHPDTVLSDSEMEQLIKSV